VKSGIEYMAQFYDDYRELSQGAGLGFFQIGGGIAGDFPICVVPSIKYDLQEEVKPWAYFCQISDSTTSYGSYSGATPNEKITWDKLTETTPMFVIESDATIVAPLMLSALLECQRHPKEANTLIERKRSLSGSTPSRSEPLQFVWRLLFMKRMLPIGNLVSADKTTFLPGFGDFLPNRHRHCQGAAGPGSRFPVSKKDTPCPQH
ncbi:MAG TPA: deoxyhypusine synthase family protein, partial [Gemmatales bacterium]|nr:deoxyhypusine synthase family protein [Gemmatales bacterium]